MTFKIINLERETPVRPEEGTVMARAFAGALVLLAGAGVVARLLALPRLLPDLDAVNFARALDGFDLAAQAPHFPGYPVYVAMARLASASGASEVLALALPGLVLGAVAIAGVGLLLRPYLGAAGALVAAALLALLPLPVLFGATPGSDGAGLALLTLAACGVLGVGDASSRVAVLAGAVAGVALGVRPSFLPALLGLALVVPRGRRLAAFAGGGLGVTAWLLPLVALTGPAELLRIGSGFLLGHAGEWGGTVAVRPELGWRLEHLGFDIMAAGLGLPWPGVGGDSTAVLAARLLLALGLAGALVALARAALHGTLSATERRVMRLALALGVPYGAWMFLGQNLLKARHALPVVLALALLVAVGVAVLARAWPSRVLLSLTGALTAATAGVMLPVALEQGLEPSPAARLVSHVSRTLPPSGTLLFTGEEARLFAHYVPHYRAGRPATGEQLRREVERVAAAGADVYVTSTAPGVEALAPHLEPVSRFVCNRRVRSHAYDLVLFHYRPAPPHPEKVL
jgi:4-amino-4-deoxy-L-arabinose transferase-like glycosyltransferase